MIPRQTSIVLVVAWRASARWRGRRILRRSRRLHFGDAQPLAAFAHWCEIPAREHSPNSVATIKQKMARLSWLHQCAHGYSIGVSAGDRIMLKGLEGSRVPAQRGKAPLSSRMLLEGRALLDFNTSHDRVLWGAAVMAWFFL